MVYGGGIHTTARRLSSAQLNMTNNLLYTYYLCKELANTDSDDGNAEMDKLLAELEKEAVPEESKPIIEKQIKKANDEKEVPPEYDTYEDYSDKEYSPEEEIEDKMYFD